MTDATLEQIRLQCEMIEAIGFGILEVTFQDGKINLIKPMPYIKVKHEILDKA